MTQDPILKELELPKIGAIGTATQDAILKKLELPKTDVVGTATTNRKQE